MTLGEKIQQARSAANLKRSELAEKIGKSERAVGLWEADKRHPGFDTVAEIAKATQFPLDYFSS